VFSAGEQQVFCSEESPQPDLYPGDGTASQVPAAAKRPWVGSKKAGTAWFIILAVAMRK
jgi:hypothetical protein